MGKRSRKDGEADELGGVKGAILSVQEGIEWKGGKMENTIERPYGYMEVGLRHNFQVPNFIPGIPLHLYPS